MYDNIPVVDPDHQPSQKLQHKIALITGGDSGIGRSVALLFAKEGADIGIVYHESDDDAQKTKRLIEAEHKTCLLFKGEIADPVFCKRIMDSMKERFGRLSILVNNAAIQYQQKELADITPEQLRYTFEVNIFSFYFLSAAALELMEVA